MQSQEREDFLIEDAKEILLGTLYHWRDWSIVLDKGYFYLWSDAVFLEFFTCSYGFFRFILDRKTAIMNPSGIVEDESDEYRRNILTHVQAVPQRQAKTGLPSQPMLSAPGATRLVVGKWTLFCNSYGEITIHNSFNTEEAIVLKEDLPGFIFQSNIGTKHLFTAETSLAPEFEAGWSKMKEKLSKAKPKLKDLKQKFLPLS